MCYTTDVVETITHLSIPALQTGKTEYKKAEGSVLTILWIWSVPDGCPRAREEVLSLARPPRALMWECVCKWPHSSSAPVPAKRGLAKVGAQLSAEAHLLIRLLGNVLLFPASHHHQNMQIASLRSKRTPSL